MVSTITPKPNTFYRKKLFDDDVAVMPVYGDAYIGFGTTIDFKSSPDSTYYLGETTIINENDYPYNAGTISEMYLSLYTNTLTQTNPQTQPYIDVYNMKSHLDFTEGDITLINDADGTGPISVYISAYDFGTPWIVEDFDGNNKSFSTAPLRVSPPGMTRIEGVTTLSISIGNWIDAIMKTHTSHSTDTHKGYFNWDNFVEETKQGLDWGSSQVAEGAYYAIEAIPRVAAGAQRGWEDIKEWAGGPAGTEESWLQTGKDSPSSNEMLTQMLSDIGVPRTIKLIKNSDGLFYMEGGLDCVKTLGRLDKWLFEDFLGEGHTRSWWIEKGATASTYITTAPFEYENFTENYVDTVSTNNTIFSQVYQRGNARDIKVETIGSAGDNEDFLAYVTAHLVKDDTATEGNAVNYKLSWENYAGAATGDTALDTANAFGRSTVGSPGKGHPLPQCIFSTITDVPMPTLFDVTTPAHTSSCAPEFEFKFKIHNMPTLPYASTSGDNKREISRSFSLILDYTTVASGNTDPSITENLADVLDPIGTEGRVAINFCKINEGNNIDVVGRLQKSVSGTGLTKTIDRMTHSLPVYYDVLPAAIGDGYHTQIPEGEWITARLKFNDENTVEGEWASGSTGLLLYFPELLDDKGQMKFINVYSRYPIGRNGFWPGQWHFWVNNMRSINEVPTTDDDTNINNGYGAIDNVPNDDKIVDVSLDRLSFYGWNTQTKNCTNNLQNGMGDLIKIPNVMGIPVASTNTQISTDEIGVAGVRDNYYGGLNNTIASYFSLGYDNSGTAYAGVQKHEILFNDFAATDNLGIQPIPDAYLLGGYFTSGNYTVHSEWFTNLGVGVSDTDNIRTGGVDNYIDNFTQKGLMRVSSSFAGWVKSGNPYVAARILSVSTDGTQITVDNANIFETDLDQEFVVEAVGGRGLCGTGYNRYTYSDYLLGSGSVGYLTSNPVTQSMTRNGNTIYLNTSILYDDAGNMLSFPFRYDGDVDYSAVGPVFFSRNSQIIISPKKYWVNMAIANCTTRTATGTNAPVATWASPRNSGSGYEDFILTNFTMSSSTGTGSGAVIRAYVVNDGNIITLDSFLSIISGGSGYAVGDRIHFSSSAGSNSSAYITVGGVTNGWADWYGQASGGYAIPLSPRGYNTAVSVSGGSTRGTTFNEFLYNDGVYTNRWGLDYKSAGSMTVNNTINYGFGAMEEQNEDGETVQSSFSLGSSRGYIQRDYLLSGQNYINLTPYARTVKPKAGEDFNFMMVPTFMESRESFYDANFDTAEGTNEALLIYGMHKPISPVESFQVSPAPAIKTDMTPNTNVTFSWIEEAKNNNTWYRLLFIDNANISNKYHNINFWAPLNETGSSFGYYTSQTDTSSTTFSNSGTVASNIEGFAGYGAYFSGSNYLLSSSGMQILANDSSRWSFLAHCKPADTNGTVFDITDLTGPAGVTQFKVVVSSSRVVVTHASSSILLTSVNSYVCDGLQPLAIGVTFDKNIPDNNWKLYVNGKVEDTADYTSANISVSGNIFIGATGRTATQGYAPFFTGFIEEITSHNNTTFYQPPNLNQYTFNTHGYDDVTTGSTNASIDYTGRLFVMDGHNIRGKGVADVARSATASWKVTGI